MANFEVKFEKLDLSNRKPSHSRKGMKYPSSIVKDSRKFTLGLEMSTIVVFGVFYDTM